MMFFKKRTLPQSVNIPLISLSHSKMNSDQTNGYVGESEKEKFMKTPFNKLTISKLSQVAILTVSLTLGAVSFGQESAPSAAAVAPSDSQGPHHHWKGKHH